MLFGFRSILERWWKNKNQQNVFPLVPSLPSHSNKIQQTISHRIICKAKNIKSIPIQNSRTHSIFFGQQRPLHLMARAKEIILKMIVFRLSSKVFSYYFHHHRLLLTCSTRSSSLFFICVLVYLLVWIFGSRRTQWQDIVRCT